MQDDIYRILNDGDFEGDDLHSENMSEIEVQRIASYVKRNSGDKRKKIKVKAVTIAACFMLGIMCFTDLGTAVMAGAGDFIKKFDPEKNYENDYVTEINDSENKNGVKLKFDECYRSMLNVTLVYTMEFEDGVPDSIKAEKDDESYFEFNSEKSFKFINYKNRGLAENCIIKINDINLKDEGEQISDQFKAFNFRGRDIEITDNLITKEIVFNLRSLTVDDDLNIEIEYDNIIDNYGNNIQGPWSIHYTLGKEEEYDPHKIDIEEPFIYNDEDGSTLKAAAYSLSNTGIKLFTEVKEAEKHNSYVFIGSDNLGNEMFLYPFLIGCADENNISEEIYDLVNENVDSRKTLDENVDSITLNLYKYFDDAGEYRAVGDKFTIDIN